MAIATSTLAMIGAGLAVGGMVGMGLAGSKKRGPLMPPPAPPAPSMGDAEAKAKEELVRRRKAMKKSATILTTPLGVEDYQTRKKTLLGE